MVLEGYIDERNQLWVTITVGGATKKQTISALIDTGFTGELTLPLHVAIPLGLQLTAATKVTFANGKESEELLFTGTLDWGTTTSRTVTVNVFNSDTPLIGGGLLHGYILLVDFEKKKLMIKEPGVDEPSPSPSPSPSPNEEVDVEKSKTKGTK